MGLLKGSVLVLVVAVILVGYAPPAEATYFSLSRVERGASWRDSDEDSSRGRSSEEADDDNSPYGIFNILRSLISRVDNNRIQIRALQRRGCESGFVNYTICPQGEPEPLTDCNLELFENGGTKIIEIPISFTQNFDDIPAVTAALSGTSFVAGKNFEIAVIERMVDGFVIQVILEDLLPFELHFSWMACP